MRIGAATYDPAASVVVIRRSHAMVLGLPDVVEVVLFNLGLVLVSEIVLYFWVYRTTAFKSVKVLQTSGPLVDLLS